MNTRLSILPVVVSVIAINVCMTSGPGQVSSKNAASQRQSFIEIGGPDLKARMNNAIGLPRSSRAPRFWMGYSFDAKDGIDYDSREVNVAWDPTVKGPAISLGVLPGTRNLGIFLLYDPTSNSIVQVECYNLDRDHDFGAAPVYWLHHAGADESLNLLKGLVEPILSGELANKSVIGIGLHSDARVGAILEDFIGKASDYDFRHWSICWLGQTVGNMSFLADLALNERESYKIRWKALEAIKFSPDPGAGATLEHVYRFAGDARLRKDTIVFAALNQVNPNLEDAARFLVDVASKDPDPANKTQALTSLGKMRGQHVPNAMLETVNSPSADLNIKREAIKAISNGPPAEAAPILIEIARTHPDMEVRRHAIRSLGGIRDSRAAEFLKEIVSK